MKQKLLSRILFLLITLIAGSTSSWADEVTYDFTKIDGFSSWSTSYAEHSVEYDEATVTFTSANRQTSTITNQPVTKGQPVSLVMKGTETISAVSITCTQWGSKAQTITLHYSTDSGENYTSTEVTSTNFTISSNNLPSGTNAVKITFSSTSNQVGIASATITYADGGDTPPVEKKNCDLALTDAPIALTFDMYNNSTAQYISYTTSSTGEITAESNAAVSCYADPETKTISVTPFASTNGKPLVITLNQAADENYKAGSVTFTVTVTDSTPEDPSKVTIWSEDFSSFSASDVPTKGTNATYTCTNGGSDTKIYEEKRAGGTSPELLVSKNNGVFSVVITDLKGCDGEMSLSFITNRTDLVVTIKPDKSWGTTTSGTIKSGTTSTLTFDIPSGTKKLTIDFSMTNSSNARLDDIVLIGKSDGKEDNGLSFSSETASAVIGGESSIFPTLTNPNDLAVTYSSSDEKVAVINEEGVITLVAAGETTITATFAGNDDYKAGSASYVLTVTAANQIATPVITLGAENFFESTTATITCETAGVTILYSADRGETWKTYTDVLTLTETTTLVAKATKEGATDSQVSEAVTASKYSVLEGLAGMAANATTKSQTSYVKLSNAQVTARAQSGNGGEMQDATTGVLLYNSSFVAGKLYNGIFSVTYVLFQGNPEITAIEAVEGEGTITDASSEVEPALVTLQELVENFSTYLHKKIIIVGATVTTALENKDASIKQNGVEMALRENNSTSVITKLTKDAEVNVVGYPAIYSSKQQIYIYSDDDISAIVDQRADSKLALGALNSTTLNVGDKIQLNYTSDSNGDITWSTSNDNVLTVDQQGNVEAVAVGEATITVAQSETESYKAGEASIKLTVVDPNQDVYVWELSKASYSNASAEQVTWSSDFATMVLEKAESKQDANSYLGGSKTYTSSCFYTNQKLTIARVEGYRIVSVLFQATSADYATAFKNSAWTNVAESTLASNVVTLTPTDGMEPIVATIGGTCGFNKVQVTYVKTEEVVTKPSIAVSVKKVTAEAEGADGTINVTYKNISEVVAEVLLCDKDGGEADYEWFSAEINADNNLDYVIEANEGEARTAYMQVHALDDEENDVYSEIITITQDGYVADFATLPFNWEGGASADLEALNGVMTNGLGSDYAASNKPYLVKFDSDNDYIQVKTDSRPGVVSVGVKMLGGGNTSTITVQESADGETFTSVQKLATSGTQNTILTLETTNTFAEASRYVRLTFTKGSNVGVGPISIAEYVAPSPSITLEHYDINVNANGGDAVLTVTCTNMPEDPKLNVKFVEADGETDATYGWITAVINGEGNIAGHMDANTGEARTAYFVVTGKDGDGNDVKSQLVKITQAAPAAPSITIEKSSIDFVAGGETDRKLSFEYESLGSNPTFEICFFDREGNAATYDWVTTATIEEDKVNLSVSANDGEARAAYFKVHAVETEVYSNLVTINQAAAPLPAVTYSLATTITSGKHYLIVGNNKGEYKAMGQQNSNNRAAVSVTLDGDKISITDEEVKEVVICGPDANGFYTIYENESGYLYAASSSGNYLKSKTTADNDGLWMITFNAETGEASVVASGSTNRNVMQYNSSSSLFSCYSSASQTAVYLYERDGEETPVASYSRDVASVKWGTICLPNTATITGAQLYSIAGKDKDEDPSALYLTEVKGTAAAGTPYIFKPTASVINAYYTGEATTIAGSENGLIGSFDGTKVAPGMYLLSEGAIKLCGEGCSIGANRAYINMDDVLVYKGGESGVKLFIGGEDGISRLDAATESAVIYDLSGRRVSKTVKGLYIVNGKKVAVK